MALKLVRGAEIFFAHCELQLIRVALLARNDLKVVELESDVFGANSKKSTNSNDNRFNLAVAVEQDVVHASDLGPVGAEHIGALEF